MKDLLNKMFSPLFIKRVKKFKNIKRGYYSFLLILFIYLISFLSEFFINSKAIIVKFDNKIFFTLYNDVKLKKDIYSKAVDYRRNYLNIKEYYEQNKNIKPDEEKLNELKLQYEIYNEIKNAYVSYRFLKDVFRNQNRGDYAFLVLYPFGPNENLLDELDSRNPPTKPDLRNIMGTDDRGRDVFARLVYGFRISMSFSLILTFFAYLIGTIYGSTMGYFGGRIDFFGMRFIEIWSSIPFLYMVMIISATLQPNFMLLIIIISLFSWIGMAWYIRAEFLKEKSKEYVQAAISIGVKDNKIIFKHILPNSLTPMVTFLPFTVISGIFSLVSLDFLGFGLPEPTPSWGELLSQGTRNLNYWWLTVSPVSAMFLTLILITFIGEAIREAFDPVEYSRLR